MPQNFNHIVLSQQAAFESLTTPIIADGAVTLPKIGTLASVVIQDLTYTAATGGTSGNDISVAYIEDVLPGQEMVTVVGTAITVHIGNPVISIEDILDGTHLQLASTLDIQVGDTIVQGLNSTTVVSIVSSTELQVGSSAGFVVGSATDNGLLSTATQVLTAIQNSYLATTLVSAVISGVPSNKQIAVAAANLINGQNSVVVSGIQADSNPLITGDVQFISGTNVSLVESGGSITINVTGAAAGVSSINTLTGDITLAAGTNVSISPSGNTLTISSTGGLSATNFIVGEDLTSQVTGTNTVFTLANTPILNKESLFLNGVRLRRGIGNDYIISGAVATLVSAPQVGDSVTADYIQS